MVNGNNYLINKNISFRGKFVVITILVIAFLFSGAIEAKIGNKELKEISETLEITNFPIFSDYSEKQLKEILDKVIKPKESKITFGILVLGAFDEIGFMDMVLTQGYKDEGETYFNSILDRKLSLFEYWKGTGKNFYDVWKLGEAVSPTRSLLMEVAPITQKTVEILIAFNSLKNMKMYDGLWYYFDLRKQGNESHEVAWKEAEIVMGFAGKPNPYVPQKLKKNNPSQLESKFSALYDKWSEYATQYGVSKKYKEQMAEELRNTLVVALEEHTFVEEPSLLEKLTQQLEDIKNNVASLMERVNPFQAGPIVVDIIDLPSEELFEDKPRTDESASKPEPESTLTQESEFPPSPPEELFEAKPRTDESAPELVPEPEPKPEVAEDGFPPTEELAPEPEPEPELESEPEPEVAEARPPQTPDETGSDPVSLCEKEPGQRVARFRVLINEVAWMGTQNSPSDEWVELKNIWGILVELQGWQLQDKDQKIKVVFDENDVIPASGYYLLERTNDDSLPEATADKIYTGALNNIDEALYLFDQDCNLEDEIIANSNWPAGDSINKRTMERFDTQSWYTSYQNLGVGTPGGENSLPPAAYSHPSAFASPLEEKTPKILITEIQIEDTETVSHDFIEFYNPNDQDADVSNWQIKKKSSSGTEYSVRVFPRGSAIAARGYFIWANYGTANTTSTQTLAKNNSIALFDKKKNTIDQAAWGTSTNPFVEGQAFSDNPDDKQNLGRKWSTTSQAYIDTDNNAEDFELQSPSQGVQLSLSSTSTGGTPSLAVVINEIAWAGNKTNSADEWIELYNNTTSTIDLTGWRLAATDGSPDVTFSSSSISAQGYFLLERTDDQTVSDITADQLYTGALSNDGEKLELRDAQNNLIDLVDASVDWPAGQASPNYLSMERISSTSTSWAGNNRVPWQGWQGKDMAGNRLNGTPKSKNSIAKSTTTVAVGGFTVDNDFTLTLLGSPYILDGTIKVLSGAKLTVESGVTVKLKKDAKFETEGEMETDGATFVAFNEEYWDWLYFKNSTSTLKNITVSHGGRLHCPGFDPECTSYTEGMLKTDGGSLTIENATVTDSQTYGVWFKDAAGRVENAKFVDNNYSNNISIALFLDGQSSPIIKNNIFKGNKTPIKTSSLLPQFSGNTAQNNDLNGILLTGFSFAEGVETINWQSADLAYILESSTTIPANKTLDIESEVIIKLQGGGRIYVDGSLQAQGKKNQEIVFTAFADDDYGGDSNNNGTSTPVQGSWEFIKFSASSTDSLLNYVLVRYGGFSGIRGGVQTQDGAIKIDNTVLTIKDSKVENSKVGIEFINSSLASASKKVAVENNKTGVYISGACPDLGDLTFSGNETNVYPASCSP